MIPTQPAARVILDSISPEGVRLTTCEIVMHRFVLAEFNTHRVFSRNSASSRAIPVHKQIDRVANDPAWPVSWPREQKGMQGGAELEGQDLGDAKVQWEFASRAALRAAKALTKIGLHKSVTNRLLEPFMWHTVVVTSTAFGNWDSLRLDPDAQPEIRAAAQALRDAREASTPRFVGEHVWHLPFVDQLEVDLLGRVVGDDPPDWADATEIAKGSDHFQNPAQVLMRVSAARCARTSYLTHDGRRDLNEDLRLYDRLVTEKVESSKGIHWSPLEHVATPWAWNRQEGCIHFGQQEHLVGIEDTFTCVPLDHLPRVGNLLGWRSLRTEVEAVNNARTFA